MQKAIEDSVEKHRGEITSFLVDLVKAKSYTPPGDTREVAEICRKKAAGFTEKVSLVRSEEKLPSLVAEIGSGSQELLFNSHIDTVPIGEAGDWIYDPFEAKIIEGMLYGRGCADAKGCVASMLMAGKVLIDCNLKLRGRLKMTLVADEEAGGAKGTCYLIEKGITKPNMVVIGEITENRIAIAEKGIFWTKITTYGQTAHASTPWTGRSAISDMIRILNKLQNYWDKKFAGVNHHLVPPPSYNIGIISGGIQINTVADRCEVFIDRRILPEENLDDCCQEVWELIEDFKHKNPDAKIEVDFSNLGQPINTDPKSDLVMKAREVCKDLGLNDELTGYAQASDGRFFVGQKVPIILLGPGVAEKAHSPNECIEVEEVIKATKIYACLAAKILGTY